MSLNCKQQNKMPINSEVNGVIKCPSHCIMEDVNRNCIHQKNYETLMEYCLDVAQELTQRQSFYTIDLADILWKVQLWKSRLPTVDIFYAVKANADYVLLKLLAMLGLSFDCAAQGEIELTMSAGASRTNIIFAHTIKTDEELKYASDVGVDLMTFDNEEELLKIHRIYPNARLLIRLNPSMVNCYFDLSDKFGCSEEEAEELLTLAKKLSLNVIGVSFHVGALCSDPSSYVSTIRSCRRLFDKACSMGFTFNILDLGGGFFGETGSEDLFCKIADGIQQALDENFPNGSGVRVIAEPGCYMAASAVRLVTTVLGKRSLKNAGEGHPARHYFLNDGVYGSFFRGIDCYGILPVPLVPESELKSRPKFESRIFGHTCCSMDIIRLSNVLPDLKVGEKVLWENMGAYSRNVCSTFCGVPLPETKYVFMKNEKLRLDWIDNKKEIKNFLKKHVVFVGCTEEDI